MTVFPPKACGILLFRENPRRQFLLMRHADRWDLPKGHMESGESELDCAFREFEEETGIPVESIKLDTGFRFDLSYPVPRRDDPRQWTEKSLVIFTGFLTNDHPIVLSEHVGYEWFPWSESLKIQPETIDPLLEAVAGYWKNLTE